MKKKILHISHHIGCFRDQKYVLNSLGFELTNFKFQDFLFRVTREVSDDFWNKNKDFINSFDYVLVSDTASISRIFFDNIQEFKPKLVIWICNRFDIEMWDQTEYYQYFKDHERYKDKIKIVASTFWEKVWCASRGVNILKCSVINPIGKHLTDAGIPRARVFSDWYGDKEELPSAQVIVPFYHNDNSYFKMADFLSKRVTVYNGTFTNVKQLKNYKALVTLPDTFCKWLSFETIQEGIPVVLPSLEFLTTLCKTPGYLFNLTGYGGAETATSDVLSLSEWYRPEFRDARFYFDDFESIKEIIDSIDMDNFRDNCLILAAKHEKKTLQQWGELYASF